MAETKTFVANAPVWSTFRAPKPQDFPGGRFGLVQDPQGASFGLLKMERR